MMIVSVDGFVYLCETLLMCVFDYRCVTWEAACVWRVNTLYPGVPSAWRAA